MSATKTDLRTYNGWSVTHCNPEPAKDEDRGRRIGRNFDDLDDALRYAEMMKRHGNASDIRLYKILEVTEVIQTDMTELLKEST